MNMNYNELGRRLYAGWVSHRLGISLATAYARHTPAQVPVFWVVVAETLDRELAERMSMALLSEPAPAAPVNERSTALPLALMKPASRLKQ